MNQNIILVMAIITIIAILYFSNDNAINSKNTINKFANVPLMSDDQIDMAYISSTCNTCNNKSPLECSACSNCGFCIGGDGIGKCIEGNIAAPISERPCISWLYGTYETIRELYDQPIDYYIGGIPYVWYWDDIGWFGGRGGIDTGSLNYSTSHVDRGRGHLGGSHSGGHGGGGHGGHGGHR